MATEIAKAAPFEHWAMSSSCAMIFLTLATDLVSMVPLTISYAAYEAEQMFLIFPLVEVLLMYCKA